MRPTHGPAGRILCVDEATEPAWSSPCPLGQALCCVEAIEHSTVDQGRYRNCLSACLLEIVLSLLDLYTMAALARVFKNKWITPPRPVKQSYHEQIIIVTGATSGIGVEAAYQFAALGAAKVIIAARDLDKGIRTKRALEARLSRADQLEVWELDMLSYDSVIAFAQRASELAHLDIAVLNAGVRRVPFSKSKYGWEEDLQVNTMSTTLLAILLLPTLKKSKHITGRIPILEMVNSGLHQRSIVPAETRLENHVLEHYNKKEHFKEGTQYSFSKVFLMYAAQQLANKTPSSNLIITSVCPGMVLTNLARDRFFPGIFVLTWVFIFFFMRTPAQGANSLLSCTTQGESVHGRFWQHDEIQPVAASLKGVEMKQLSARIWDEIVQALEKDVPEVRALLSTALDLQ